MPPVTKWFLFLATTFSALGVILGAFGAHALKGKLADDLLAAWQTAVLYHLVHALGLLAVAFAGSLLPGSSLVRWAGWTMTAGILLFSGSLYAMCLLGFRGLGAITPFGGIGFVVAWLILAAAVRRG